MKKKAKEKASSPPFIGEIEAKRMEPNSTTSRTNTSFLSHFS